MNRLAVCTSDRESVCAFNAVSSLGQLYFKLRSSAGMASLLPRWMPMLMELSQQSLVSLASPPSSGLALMWQAQVRILCNGFRLVSPFHAARSEVRGAFELHPTLKPCSIVTDDYSGARNAEGIVQFINERTGLAKTLPKEATNVQHLTDATFNSIVMDPTKSALVEFYAPWCGHCKNLAPTYKKLADAFAGDENVAIVAVDATENRATTEAYGVKGYPTLKWFPAGAGKEAVDYAAGRDLDSFVNFINEHAGTAR